MMRPPLSVAAAGLLRAILNRAGVDRQRILLVHFRSVDWYSLTLSGERHEMELKIAAPDSAGIAGRLLDGIGEAEFDIPGQIVADIAVREGPTLDPDGSTRVTLEALTLVE